MRSNVPTLLKPLEPLAIRMDKREWDDRLGRIRVDLQSGSWALPSRWHGGKLDSGASDTRRRHRRSGRLDEHPAMTFEVLSVVEAAIWLIPYGREKASASGACAFVVSIDIIDLYLHTIDDPRHA